MAAVARIEAVAKIAELVAVANTSSVNSRTLAAITEYCLASFVNSEIFLESYLDEVLHHQRKDFRSAPYGKAVPSEDSIFDTEEVSPCLYR